MTGPIDSGSVQHTTISTTAPETVPTTAPSSDQVSAASMNVLISGTATLTSATMAGEPEAPPADGEASAPPAQLAAISSDAGGGEGGGGDHSGEEEPTTTTTTANSSIATKQLHLPTPNLSAGNNVQAAAEEQMERNGSIYSSASPQDISTKIDSLSTSLQASASVLSPATVITAGSYLGVASQLAGQLSNPSQAANSATIRADIQSNVTSAYSAVASDMLANPDKLTAQLSTVHISANAQSITTVMTNIQNGTQSVPTASAVQDRLAGQTPPSSSMKVISDQQLCNLLGSFAASVQNNTLLSGQYASAGAVNSSNIAATTVASQGSALSSTVTQEKKQAQEEQKAKNEQKQSGILNDIMIAVEVVAIVVLVACTPFTGGASDVLAAVLIGVMMDQIVCTADPSVGANANVMTDLTNGTAKVLEDFGMSSQDAQIVAAVAIGLLMIVGGSYASAGGAAEDATMATREAITMDSPGVMEDVIAAGGSVAPTTAATTAAEGTAVTAQVTSTSTAQATTQATATTAETTAQTTAQASEEGVEDADLATRDAVTSSDSDAVSDASGAAKASTTTAMNDTVAAARVGISDSLTAAQTSFNETLSAISDQIVACLPAGTSGVINTVGVAAAIIGTAAEVYQGVTSIQLGLLQEQMADCLRIIANDQSVSELMQSITTMQTALSSQFMQFYSENAQALQDGNAIQNAAGAGSTLAQQLSQNAS